MMDELISVIVPIYKVEKYIHRCVDSIINQSYTNLEGKTNTSIALK